MVTSLAEHSLQACRLQWLGHMSFVVSWHIESFQTWDRTLSPALAGEFLTIRPPRKSACILLDYNFVQVYTPTLNLLSSNLSIYPLATPHSV